MSYIEMMKILITSYLRTHEPRAGQLSLHG